MVVSIAFPLLHAALDCVIVMDAAGRILEFNASAESTFGRRREDVVGQVLAEVIIPERWREAHRRGLARVLETGASAVLGKRLELRALRVDGSEFPVELTISSSSLAGEKVFVGFIRDLTDRSRVEEQRERAFAEAASAARRFERLQASTAALGSARTVHDVADAVLSAGVDAIGAATATFVRPVGDALGIVASIGLSDEVRASFQTLSRDALTPTAAAFRTGEAEWIEDEQTFRARYGAVVDVVNTATAAAAAIPLRIGGKVAAVVAFRFGERRAFAASDRALLETFAAQAAQALERVLGYEQELESRRKLDALADLTSRLATTLSEAEVGAAVIERGMLAMSADTCTLYRVEDDGALVLVAERGCSPTVVAAIQRIEAGSENPTAETIRTGRTLWVESAAAYHRLFPSVAAMPAEGPRAKAFWSVPLIVENRAIGLLAMGFYEPRRFSPDDRAFVETFSRNAAQALRRAQRLEAETRVRHALETTLTSIGDAVIATDPGGLVTFFNPVAERLTGWKREDALRRPVADVFRVVSEQTRALAESPVERALRDGLFGGLANSTLLVARDGSEIAIDATGAPIRDARNVLMGAVLVFRDVTAKKREDRRRAFVADAVTTLASSLDYEETLTRVASLAVPTVADWCAVDLLESDAINQVSVAHVDPSKVELARALGERYPPDAGATTGVPNVIRTGIPALYPELSPTLIDAAARDPEHGRILRELGLRSAMIVPLVARGQVLGAMTFIYAESGRVYAQDDLAFAEDLGRRAAVAVDNARLYAAEQRARQAADVANRVKDDFLATVSHELRTPLNAIMGWAKLLGVGTPDPPRLSRAIATIERNSVAMAQLIDDLLDVSRIVSGRLRVEIQAVDLASIVRAAIESVRPVAAAREITLHEELPAAAPMQADPARIQQVVWNLLSNAVKFSQTGGRVSVAVRATDPFFEIRVRDEGRGIDPRFLPHVFDSFRQADARITRTHGGLGLGLAITRQIVELHRGTIDVESAGEGCGATFLVRLPARSTASRAGTDGETTAPGRLASFDRPRELRGLRVLVVDDADDARELLRTILEDCGCMVRTAGSAQAAVEEIERDAPDILVSDIGMPGEDGYALIRRVRKMAMPRGAMPALALTAYTRAEDRRAALEAGFMMHLSKPIEPDELVGVLASLVRSFAPVTSRH